VAYKEVNFKSKLIEWSQKNRVKLDFRLLKQEKDANGSPKFYYQVALEEKVLGEKGEGYSKKEAQQQASKLTLQRLRKEPQFIDRVFGAKTERTKMEEMPTMAVPDTEEQHIDFIQESAPHPMPSQKAKPRKGQTAERLERFDGTDPVKEAKPARQPVKAKEMEAEDEFDLSDIKTDTSREDIIAAAEAAAFND
jgi:ribonuclease-3